MLAEIRCRMCWLTVDFHLVTETLLKEFEQQRITYAVIGGFALGFWGVTRTTVDMDFLLLLDDAVTAEAILEKFGYKPVYKTENVAQYVADDIRYGSVDFIYAFRQISRNMLARSVLKPVTSELSIRCLIPEDIIGLKLQALVNDPAREPRDMADIDGLLSAMKHRQEPVDWRRLEEYFALFDKLAMLNDLAGKYGNAE